MAVMAAVNGSKALAADFHRLTYISKFIERMTVLWVINLWSLYSVVKQNRCS